MNVEQMFRKEVDSKKIFLKVKRPNLAEDELRDPMDSAFVNYESFMSSQDRSKLIESDLLHYSGNELCLLDQVFTSCEGAALARFIEQVKDVESKRIHKLVVDGCTFGDEDLCHILSAIESQSSRPKKGHTARNQQFLLSVAFSNIRMEAKSFGKLLALIPGLSELALNNVQIPLLEPREFAAALLEAIAREGKHLLKLRISDI